MIHDVLSILSFQAFRIRDDDPVTHFTRKVGSNEFVVAILGHQHIKYAKARLRNRKLVLDKPVTGFCDNIQSAELETQWVAEMLAETSGVKYLLLGLNLQFNNLKIYPADQKLRDIERAFSENLEEEVGKTYEKQTKYFLSQAGAQICLNGVEREKILKPLEKFRKWGFTVAGAFHYPTAVIAHVSAMPLDWDNPGMLIYYAQKLIFSMGWHKGEVITLRSRLIAEAQRGATGTRPTLNTLQKEIETTAQIVTSKAGGPIVSIYKWHDKQDQSFAGLESIYKNAHVITWPQENIVSETLPYPEPDLGVVRELSAHV